VTWFGIGAGVLAVAATPILRRLARTDSTWTRGWWHVPVAVLLGAVTGIAPAPAVVGALLGVMAVIGSLLIVVDLAEFRLPDPLVLAAAVVWVVGVASLAVWGGDWIPLGRSLASGAATFLAFLVLVLVAPTGLGFGDVKLAGVCGLVLGWFGWTPLLTGLAAAVVLNGLVAVVVLAVTRDRRADVAMGPSLVLGVVLGITWAGAVFVR
jgi:leader peptidase (prepilin peptidase) / N-methyltransferase